MTWCSTSTWDTTLPTLPGHPTQERVVAGQIGAWCQVQILDTTSDIIYFID